MSRSRKKHPIVRCGDTFYKKIFNRRFRRKKDLDFPSGSAYRKTNESWDICDFVGGYFDKKEIPEKENRKYWYEMK